MDYGPASKYYDLFGSKDDVAFYRELAIKHGCRALELGVGTGRVTIELAKAGVTVLGIDNSRYMLNVARSKRASSLQYYNFPVNFMRATGDRIRSVCPCRTEDRAVISIARMQRSVWVTAFLRPLVRRCFNPK